MKQTGNRHASLFLIELMISLLFFSIAAAVCIRFFVQAQLLSQKSANLNEAVLICESAAEEFRAADGRLPDADVYYDAGWELCNKDNAVFTRHLSISPADNDMLLADIFVYQDPKVPIYTLEVKICP